MLSSDSTRRSVLRPSGYALINFAVLLALLRLVGCPPPKKQPQATSSQDGKEVVRSEYRWPLPSDPMTLDPAHLTDTVSDAVARRLFNTLVRFGEDGAIVDDLAESHSISADGLTYS